MKFSFIIPVFNVENYLCECLKSVLCQTVSDYEIVLIDDGSTDSSGMICDSYKKKYNCIQVIHQKNQGPSAARNCGIEKAKGEYLLFLDSDDYYLNPNCLKEISEKADGCDIVSFNWNSIDETNFVRRVSGKELMHQMGQCYESGQDYLLDALSYIPLYKWFAWRYAIRREFWILNSFDFMEGAKYEDYELMYRVLLKAQKINVLNSVIYGYRINRTGSTVNDFNLSNALDLLEHTQNNIKDIIQNSDIQQNLRRKLCNNFSAEYYAVINKAISLREEDYLALLHALNKCRWVCQYTAMGGLQKIERAMISILGIQPAIWFFGYARNIKIRCNRIQGKR